MITINATQLKQHNLLIEEVNLAETDIIIVEVQSQGKFLIRTKEGAECAALYGRPPQNKNQVDSGPDSNEEDEEEEKVQIRNRNLTERAERNGSHIQEVDAQTIELDFLKYDIKRVLKSSSNSGTAGL